MRLVKGLFQRSGLFGEQANLAAREKVFESQVTQLIQVAQLVKPLADDLVDLTLAAIANPQFPKFRMPNRHIYAQITYPVAQWAIRVSRQVVQGQESRLNAR